MSVVPGLAEGRCEPMATWTTKQPPGHWFKATSSNGSCACVEARLTIEGLVEIRDSKYLRFPDNDPTVQPIIRVEASEFAQWISEVRGLTAATANGAIVSRSARGARVVVVDVASGVELTFTATEWDAFTAGVSLGEFDLALAPA